MASPQTHGEDTPDETVACHRLLAPGVPWEEAGPNRTGSGLSSGATPDPLGPRNRGQDAATAVLDCAGPLRSTAPANAPSSTTPHIAPGKMYRLLPFMPSPCHSQTQLPIDSAL